MSRTEYALLGVLLLVYLALGALFAIRTPPWQAPDEPAHVNYVRQLVEGRLPVIEPGDWDQAYLSQVVGAEFAPAYPVDGITYEDWQPPLYYLLQAPVYALSGGSLTAMRLLSVALGAGVVALAYVVGRAVFGRVAPALAVAAFVAFLPQHLAILGSVNNDALSELIIAAILALLVTPWPAAPATRRLLALGLLLGAGFLTKGQAYLMAPVVAVFLLVRYWPRPDRSRRPVRSITAALLLVFIPALLLGALVWGRNAAVYGGLDVLARAAHDEVVVGQPRTAEWLAQYGLAGTLGRFARTTFVSFWGQFGWMAAPLPGWMVTGLLALTGVAGLGLVMAAVSAQGSRGAGEQGREERATRHSPPATRLSSVVLVLTFLLTLGLHVAYNLTFVQHQGRYLYPALIPIAVGFVAGLGYWLRPLVRRRPWAEWLLPVGLAGLLMGIALFALYRILPGLAPG
jgi:4-amino-4-deoxy-L-arabinose transferase-like glycosyltransferase